MNATAVLERKQGPPSRLTIPLGFGFLGFLLMVAFYFIVVGLAQDWQHARELLWQDRYFVGAIALGFGVQLGLYVHLRQELRLWHGTGMAAATMAAGTGTSSLGMLACCLHHGTDLLPILGLSGATAFLGQYRIPFMLLGISTNLLGIGLMVRKLRRIRRMECHPQES